MQDGGVPPPVAVERIAVEADASADANDLALQDVIADMRSQTHNLESSLPDDGKTRLILAVAVTSHYIGGLVTEVTVRVTPRWQGNAAPAPLSPVTTLAENSANTAVIEAVRSLREELADVRAGK
jgi:hypothetical protein